MPPKVFIIVLNWQRYEDTKECLLSLSGITYPNYTVLLIDNGSLDGSFGELKKEFPGILSIRNERNLGFAEGSNAGIRVALAEGADYVLLLNNDTAVEKDFLDRLVPAFQQNQEIGIASPKIMSYQERERIWFAGGGYLPFLRKPVHLYYNRIERGQVPAVAETEWASGCAMLVKREVFEQIGLLDADYGSNYEDVDFCVRARRAGFKIIIVPAAKIYHKFAVSMGGKFSPLYAYFRTRNNLLFFRKTGQFFPLVLNLLVFPVYSIIESLRHRQWDGVWTTFLGVFDFMRGKFGQGPMA